jgi:hypothetical protein
MMLPDNVVQELLSIKNQLELGEARMGSIEVSLSEAKILQAANSKVLVDIKELLELGRTSVKLLRYIGLAIKWISTLLAGLTVVWAVFSNHPPKG